MSAIRTVVLTRVNSLIQAEMIQSLLNVNGIPCEIRDKGQADVLDGAAAALTGGIILTVPEDQLDHAREVLETAKEAGKLLPEDSEGEVPEV